MPIGPQGQVRPSDDNACAVLFIDTKSTRCRPI